MYTHWLTLFIWWGVLDPTLCDKIRQWLETGQWFSLGTPVSSTNETDCHDITEILLKVALNTKPNQTETKLSMTQFWDLFVHEYIWMHHFRLLLFLSEQFKEVLQRQTKERKEKEMERIRLMNADPFSAEAQQMIAEEIRSSGKILGNLCNFISLK